MNLKNRIEKLESAIAIYGMDSDFCGCCDESLPKVLVLLPTLTPKQKERNRLMREEFHKPCEQCKKPMLIECIKPPAK